MAHTFSAPTVPAFLIQAGVANLLAEPCVDTRGIAMQYHVVFHPMSLGVGEGNRGPLGEVRVSYLIHDDAIRNKDAQPPRSGYVAVKIIDDAGKIYRERTAGQHIASCGCAW